MEEINAKHPIEIEYHESFGDKKINPHFHNACELIYILEGEVEIRVGSKSYKAGKNHMVFISNLESHELTVIQYPYKRYFILIHSNYLNTAISEPVLSSIFRQRPNFFKHILPIAPEEFDQILRIFLLMHQDFTNRSPYYQQSICACLNLLLIVLYRKYPDYFPISSLNQTMENVLSIQKHIDENFTQDLKLKNMADTYFMDMYYLSHTFKKITGLTFKEYLILQRLAHAKKLLIHSIEDITSVAQKSGFNNVNHFIRLFNKSEGTTPFQFRKLFKP